LNQPIPFGKYFLLERINMGGMAEVFRAKAYGVEGFERLVAVKRILPSISEDKDFIRMFIDEAKIAVQLSHANIAQVFDLGRVGGSYYIALEHVHGRDLRALYDRCREGGEPMPVAQACFIVMQMCEGLDYAHNRKNDGGEELGLVHRDVSPQNVLVSFEGEVKVIDFGIAKAAGRCSRTQAGILKGKFAYMSPEQVRGHEIDRRSDVFSTGIVLYEMLTGRRLFIGESDFSTLEKVRKAKIDSPSLVNENVPEELSRIVLKSLARETEDRYESAMELHDDLQRFVFSSGLFFSRKELSLWMKDRFSEEIANEVAKLEKYRHMRPPEAPRTTFGRATFETRPTTSVISANTNTLGEGNTQRTSVERQRLSLSDQRGHFDKGPTRVTRLTDWREADQAESVYQTSGGAGALSVREAPPLARPRRAEPARKRDRTVGRGSTPVPASLRNLRELTPMPSVEERKRAVTEDERGAASPRHQLPPRPHRGHFPCLRRTTGCHPCQCGGPLRCSRPRRFAAGRSPSRTK